MVDFSPLERAFFIQPDGFSLWRGGENDHSKRLNVQDWRDNPLILTV
jgi:hypothetical protein